MYEFHWEWCETCECWMIVCPKCGNNCCNGGFGLDGSCEVCNLAYQYQDLAIKAGMTPDISKETLKMIDRSMENFKKGIVSKPIDLEKL